MNFAEGDKVVTESIDIVTKSVVKYMIKNGLRLCTAESCTGGMISQTVTEVAGASQMFLGGACTYTEEVKMKLLGVKGETLEKFSVYSEQTAGEMSSGAMKLFGADCAVAVTGIAGPGGGTEDKPVGTVYVSVRNDRREIVRTLRLDKEYENLDRRMIRMITTLKALEMVLELYGQKTEDDINVNG